MHSMPVSVAGMSMCLISLGETVSPRKVAESTFRIRRYAARIEGA